MARLEDLIRGAQVKGIRPDGPVEVLDAKWHGGSALELTYKAPDGKPGNELLFRGRRHPLGLVTAWPELTRLSSQAASAERQRDLFGGNETA